MKRVFVKILPKIAYSLDRRRAAGGG